MWRPSPSSQNRSPHAQPPADSATVREKGFVREAVVVRAGSLKGSTSSTMRHLSLPFSVSMHVQFCQKTGPTCWGIMCPSLKWMLMVSKGADRRKYWPLLWRGRPWRTDGFTLGFYKLQASNMDFVLFNYILGWIWFKGTVKPCRNLWNNTLDSHPADCTKCRGAGKQPLLQPPSLRLG